MTYRGHVQNGQIKLDEPAELPDGAKVSVQVIEGANGEGAYRFSRAEMLRLPVEERRRLLAEQSDRLAAHYANEDRSNWQGGDIVE